MSTMSLYPLVYLNDPRLRQETQVIDKFDDELRQLIADMFETMYHENGVGLAATQIGIAKKVAVIDTTRDKSQRLVIINPEIIQRGELTAMQEGCLSVPGAYDTVMRANEVTVKAQDEHGEWQEIHAKGLLAEALQHEIDHLNGRVFIDLLSPIKRQRAKKRMEKVLRQRQQS